MYTMQIFLKMEDGATHQKRGALMCLIQTWIHYLFCNDSQDFEFELGQCLRVYRHDPILTEVPVEQKEAL